MRYLFFVLLLIGFVLSVPGQIDERALAIAAERAKYVEVKVTVEGRGQAADALHGLVIKALVDMGGIKPIKIAPKDAILEDYSISVVMLDSRFERGRVVGHAVSVLITQPRMVYSSREAKSPLTLCLDVKTHAMLVFDADEVAQTAKQIVEMFRDRALPRTKTKP